MPNTSQALVVTTSNQIAPGIIINSDVNSAAAIAFSKLAALTSAQLLIGNGSNVAVDVALSGDATMDNAGVLTIANDAINAAKLGIMTTKGDMIGFSTLPLRIAVGTNDQVWTADSAQAAGAKWASASAAKEIKVATATWTSQYINSSTSYLDITSATVTLSGLTSGKTYTLHAMATVSNGTNSGAAGRTTILMVVDGTAESEQDFEPPSGGNLSLPALIGTKTGVTGSTSYIAKLQAKAGSGSVQINNGSNITSVITLMAIEE